MCRHFVVVVVVVVGIKIIAFYSTKWWFLGYNRYYRYNIWQWTASGLTGCQGVQGEGKR